MNENIFIIFIAKRIIKVPEMISQIIKINTKIQFDELYNLLIANETENKLQKFITRFSKEKGLECQQDFNSFIISLVEYKKKSADFKIIATTNRIYKILKLDKISLFDDFPKIINEKLLGWRFKNNKSAIESLKIILELGANINIKNSLGETPLHRAKNFANIKILIAYGADVNAVNNKGVRPIQKTRNSDIIRLLRENGANSNIDNNLIIKSIPKIKNADIIKLLIGNGVNPNGAAIKLLLENCTDVNPDVIKLLLENCTDVNLDVIKLLLGSYPNVNAQDSFGNTLLHYANNITVVKMLLFRDANTNIENFEGKTPLDLATGEKYNLLLKCGGKYGSFSKLKAVNSQDSELIDFNNIFHYESSALEQQKWDEFLKDITTSQQQNNDTEDLVNDGFVINQSQLVEQQKWDEFLKDITTPQQQNNDTEVLVNDGFVIKQSQLVEQQKWNEFLKDIIGQDSK